MNILEPGALHRPDISTDDCLLRSIEIEEKVIADHESVFGITSEEDLDGWMHVCCGVLTDGKRNTCHRLQPKDRHGNPVQLVRLRSRRTRYRQEYAAFDQDYAFDQMEAKRKKKEEGKNEKKKKKKQQKGVRVDVDEDGDTLMERFLSRPPRSRKRTQKMVESMLQAEPPRKKRRTGL